MATKIDITEAANSDILDESNFAQQWEKWKQSSEFYLGASGTADDSQMRLLLLQCTVPDVQYIFRHLEGAGTTYKAAMDALNIHFEPKKNFVFKMMMMMMMMMMMNCFVVWLTNERRF